MAKTNNNMTKADLLAAITDQNAKMADMMALLEQMKKDLAAAAVREQELTKKNEDLAATLTKKSESKTATTKPEDLTDRQQDTIWAVVDAADKNLKGKRAHLKNLEVWFQKQVAHYNWEKSHLLEEIELAELSQATVEEHIYGVGVSRQQAYEWAKSQTPKGLGGGRKLTATSDKTARRSAGKVDRQACIDQLTSAMPNFQIVAFGGNSADANWVKIQKNGKPVFTVGFQTAGFQIVSTGKRLTDAGVAPDKIGAHGKAYRKADTAAEVAEIAKKVAD